MPELAVVTHLCERLMVMQPGRFAEAQALTARSPQIDPDQDACRKILQLPWGKRATFMITL